MREIYVPPQAMDNKKKKEVFEHNEAKTSMRQDRSAKDLLLSSAQAREVNWQDRYIYSAQSGDQKINVFGIKHSNQLDEVSDFEDSINSEKPDIILTEARPLTEYFPELKHEQILNLSPEEIIKMEEQIYFRWLAEKQGYKTESWDITGTDQIRETLNMRDESGRQKHSPDQAIAWLATYSMRKLYEDKTTPSMQNLRELISLFAPGIEEHIDLSPEKIDQIIKEGTGYSLEELAARADNESDRAEDQKLVTELSEPSTNAFAIDKDIMRDRIAIDKIEACKRQGYKNIFVTAGGTHAVIWENAVKNLYQSI